MTEPSQNVIFVFATTEAQIPWTGRAKIALTNHGASTDVTRGLCGQSYAINTHDRFDKSLPEDLVEAQIQDFKQFAADNPQNTYLISHIGSLRPICGNCIHREYRSFAPPAKQTLGNCAFEPDGYWFGPTYACTNRQHSFTTKPKSPPTATGWSVSSNNKKAARPVDTPI